MYFFKGFRNYTDAINDRTFLTLTVAILAAFVIYQIQKPGMPTLASDVRPLLVVPDFEDDERRQFKSVFIQQLEAFIGRLNKDAAIVSVAAHITDRASAKLTGKTHNAVAVVYQPKVIRLDDKKTVLCFSLLLLDADANKAYPPVPAEIEKDTLQDIAALLLGPLVTNQKQNDPTLGRIEELERKVDQLATAVFKATALSQAPPAARKYRAKHALVIGVNSDKDRQKPKLQYAVSDAQSMNAVLGRLGFATTMLLEEGATRAQVLREIDKILSSAKPDDLVLIYYAGSGIRSTDLWPDQSKDLILSTFDLSLKNPEENLTLNAVVKRLSAASDKYRLIIVDACHGTYGLPLRTASTATQTKTTSAERTFQVITGTQDEEYGLEVGSGGLFTSLVSLKLNDMADSNGRLSTNDLLAATSAMIGVGSGGRQRPKIVTLSGTEDVFLDSDGGR